MAANFIAGSPGADGDGRQLQCECPAGQRHREQQDQDAGHGDRQDGAPGCGAVGGEGEHPQADGEDRQHGNGAHGCDADAGCGASDRVRRERRPGGGGFRRAAETPVNLIYEARPWPSLAGAASRSSSATHGLHIDFIAPA